MKVDSTSETSCFQYVQTMDKVQNNDFIRSKVSCYKYNLFQDQYVKQGGITSAKIIENR
jgi:hypothetical protein